MSLSAAKIDRGENKAASPRLILASADVVMRGFMGFKILRDGVDQFRGAAEAVINRGCPVSLPNSGAAVVIIVPNTWSR